MADGRCTARNRSGERCGRTPKQSGHDGRRRRAGHDECGAEKRGGHSRCQTHQRVPRETPEDMLALRWEHACEITGDAEGYEPTVNPVEAVVAWRRGDGPEERRVKSCSMGLSPARPEVAEADLGT